jgi:3-oxoacyl-(acyl-carrier-protein) synthase
MSEESRRRARDASERLVVTGMGMVSPYGPGVGRFLEAVRGGRTAIRPLREADVPGCECTWGAPVPELDLDAFDHARTFRRAPRATQYATLATDEALRAAQQNAGSWKAERVGVLLGTFRGMAEVSEQIWIKLVETDPRFVPALLFQEVVTNAVASAISLRWELRGTSYSISSGNGAGYHVLDLAAQALRAGRADLILAGAFDIFTPTNHQDLDDLGLLSPSNLCRPFDVDRDGLLMGEGAAVVVLETLAHARARGAAIQAEITGIGVAHDAHGSFGLHPEGRGLALAIREALDEAHLSAEDVDYVGAAANSTAILDRAESRALHSVLGEAAARVPVSSVKALTGEAMAASDIFNLAACIAAVGDGLLPVQAGTDHVDPQIELNVVRSSTRRRVRAALANSYSYFGGSAAAAVVEGSPD